MVLDEEGVLRLSDVRMGDRKADAGMWHFRWQEEDENVWALANAGETSGSGAILEGTTGWVSCLLGLPSA